MLTRAVICLMQREGGTRGVQAPKASLIGPNARRYLLNLGLRAAQGQLPSCQMGRIRFPSNPSRPVNDRIAPLDLGVTGFRRNRWSTSTSPGNVRVPSGRVLAPAPLAQRCAAEDIAHLSKPSATA